MEKIEIILDNYSQETKDAALVAALKSGNSTLVELVLKLKPDIRVGEAELFKYAIKSCNFELLSQMLRDPEIRNNQKLMDEGVYLAVSLTRVDWYEVLSMLIKEGASADVAVKALLEIDNPSFDAIVELLKSGAKAHFWPMHLDKHQLIAEKLFKEGFSKSVNFSEVGLEQFCLTICQNNKQGVIKRIAKERPDMVGKLTEVAVNGGYSSVVRLLHQEKAITTIDDKLFEKAINKKHYFTVKYLVESGIRELKHTDVIDAAAFGSTKIVFFLIEQMKLQGRLLTSEKIALAIDFASIFNRTDTVKALLEAGYNCDFDGDIKRAATHGEMKIVDILMKYATKLSNATFDEGIRMANMNNYVHVAFKMREYRRKNPEKFE